MIGFWIVLFFSLAMSSSNVKAIGGEQNRLSMAVSYENLTCAEILSICHKYYNHETTRIGYVEWCCEIQAENLCYTNTGICEKKTRCVGVVEVGHLRADSPECINHNRPGNPFSG